MIDLHCHSNYSDGFLKPKDLLALAIKLGVRVLALTDHDTTQGLAELRDGLLPSTIHLIDGIELSAVWKKQPIHVLGLRINIQHEGLVSLVQRQTDNRITRAKNIAKQLETIGLEDGYQKACVLAGHERIGRAHYAQLLVDEKHCPDWRSAFKRYLGQGRVAYVPVSWCTLDEAVGAIVAAGGDAVLAHPLKYKLTRTKLQALAQAFKDAGGCGLEVVSGEMTPEQTQEMAGLTQRLGLLASSGSDFHGEQLSRIALGHQRPLPPGCEPIWEQKDYNYST